mmetsp:Transcript_80073/g.134084  ORF Transcript_80073/g.134084 Transcript_80073/m.134084 type:complete len:80 (+) Transcript_80073:222-461(+)
MHTGGIAVTSEHFQPHFCEMGNSSQMETSGSLRGFQGTMLRENCTTLAPITGAHSSVQTGLVLAAEGGKEVILEEAGTF